MINLPFYINISELIIYKWYRITIFSILVCFNLIYTWFIEPGTDLLQDTLYNVLCTLAEKTPNIII